MVNRYTSAEATGMIAPRSCSDLDFHLPLQDNLAQQPGRQQALSNPEFDPVG